MSCCQLEQVTDALLSMALIEAGLDARLDGSQFVLRLTAHMVKREFRN